MRVPCLCLWLILAGCSGKHQDEEEDASTWDTIIHAMYDEIRGEPSAAALAETRRFSRTGVSFFYPALLRARVDKDEYPSWGFSRGEFELEFHAPDTAFSAESYLDALVTALDPDESAEVDFQLALTVNWCGTSITGVVRQVTIYGDDHRYQGFDLPAGANGSRFLIFGDKLQNGYWSATAQATFDAISASIQCETPIVE